MSHISVDSISNMSRVEGTSPFSLGKESLTSVSHVEDSSQTTSSHVGGMNVDKKPRCGCFKPSFPYNICKGDHLMHLCPGIP